MSTFPFKLILLLLGMGITIPSYAQQSPFRIGLLANLNGMHLNGQTDAFWNPGEGIIWGSGGCSFGAKLIHESRGPVDYGFEMRFIQKGSLLQYTNLVNQKDYEGLWLNYFEIPFYAEWKHKINRGSLLVHGGAAIGYLFNTKLKYSEETQRPNSADATEFKDIDISWVAALKYRPRKSKNLVYGLRVSRSVLSIHERYLLRNLTYGIEVEYRFSL